jgi:hypothetical protein
MSPLSFIQITSLKRLVKLSFAVESNQFNDWLCACIPQANNQPLSVMFFIAVSRSEKCIFHFDAMSLISDSATQNCFANIEIIGIQRPVSWLISSDISVP